MERDDTTNIAAYEAVPDEAEFISTELRNAGLAVKPFAFTELLARLQALLRRSGNGNPTTAYTVANLTLDIHTRKVYRDDEQIELQPMEFKILEYLMRRSGQVVSKTMIMENVWEYSFNPRTNVVEARICYLREKIDKHFNPKLIHTIRGMGYVLEDRT